MDNFNITKWNKTRYLSEAGVDVSKSSQLIPLFNNAIDEIDENLSYKDLALTISAILKNEYGSHNFDPFMEVLHAELGIKENMINEYGEYNDVAKKLQAEAERLFNDSARISMGDYGEREDSDPLKGKGYGKLSFIEKNDVSPDVWDKVINWVKSKGYEITDESNYYEREYDNDRSWYPNIKFQFNIEDIKL